MSSESISAISKGAEQYLNRARDAILNSSAKIDEEYQRSKANNWLACFSTRLAVLSGSLELAQMSGLETDKISKEKARLDALVKKVESMRELYPSRENDVPEEEREKLLSELDIFKEAA